MKFLKMLQISKVTSKKDNKMYDIIVIGGGPSGMTAALYGLRSGKSVLILEKENFGGQIANSPRLENFPSIKEISGLDFSSNLFEQITNLGAEFELEEVLKIEKEDNIFTIKTNYSTHQAKTVIIANGVKHRHTNVVNEEKFIGKGVSYCAVCDGAFYKGQEVYLIGDANTALQYALLLSNYCKKVHIITLFDRFFADKVLVDRVLNRENIDVRHNLNLNELVGNSELEKIVFTDTKTKEKVSYITNALFIAIGQIPENKTFNELVELKDGYIVTNDKMETKTTGLFAVGDTRKKDIRQLVTACNDGAIAAINAVRYIDQ